MRKFVSMLLVLTLLFPRGIAALASENIELASQQAETSFPCSTSLKLARNSYKALITKTASRLQATYSVPTSTVTAKLLPSIGTVKIPVIPIDFEGARMDESLYTELVDYYNAEYDPEKALQAPTEQSVRGAFEKLSYGRLNLQADVLPIYHAEYGIAHYATSEADVTTLAQDALEYYISQGLLDVANYDYDRDGEMEYASIKFYIPPEQEKYLGSPFGFYVATAPRIEKVHGFSCTLIYEWHRKTIGESCNSDVHEILHMMGLPDRYGPDYHQNYLEANLADIMTAGCEMYLNVYERILLEWLDPLILTNENSPPTAIELSAVEKYADTEMPKAVVLIPDPLLFPFTEFYVLEYRNATQEAFVHPDSAQAGSALNYFFFMYGHPGIVIWHCNTMLSSSNWYEDESMYIKPVYKSGKVIEQNGYPSQLFDSSDLYDVGDKFSSNSEPTNSDFYNGIYTGAYLEVESITPEKAVIKAGFRDPDLTPPPTVEFLDFLPAINNKEWPKKVGRVAFKDGNGDLIPAEKLPDVAEIEARTNRLSGDLVNANEFSVQMNLQWPVKNPKVITAHINKNVGEGSISWTLCTGAFSWNGKYVREATSPVIYVDNTPPEIILNGENPQRVELGDEYVESGAQTSDNLDAKIENNVKLSIDNSQVNTQELGTYSVTYSAKDEAGNQTEVKRTVIVEDTIAPTATVTYSTTQPTNGDVVATLVPSEEVTVTNNEGSLTHTFTANGSFTFEFKDEAGNKGTAIATVANIDKSLPGGTVSYDITGPTNQNVTATLTVEPGITILNNNGNTHVFTENGSFEFRIRNAVGTEGVVAAAVSWIDKMAPTAKVEYSTTTLTNRDVVATIAPSEEVTVTSEGGTNHTFMENGSFTFKFVDKAGNTGSITATVDWIDKEAPVIIPNGDNPLIIQKGDPYEELGATVTDNTDEDIESRLVIDSSNVDTSTAGEYTVTYNATDEAGNKAETKTRTVKVKEPPSPPLPPDLPDPPTPPVWENPFTDVKEGDWFYRSVEYVCENGLFYGTGEKTFSPNGDMTRGMLATVLYRLAKEPGATADDLFNDVAEGRYYTKAIAWAAENDIAAGYGNGRFGPDDSITREQLAAILWRYSGSPESSGSLDRFTDGNKASNYAVPALQWAVEQKIVSGKGSSILDPKGNATRAEVASILMRYCEKLF